MWMLMGVNEGKWRFSVGLVRVNEDKRGFNDIRGIILII